MTKDKLINELQVHQIELEMQNDELHKTRQELEKVKNEYFDLYNFAPVGYLVLNEEDLIVNANLTGTTMLGVGKSKLVNLGFSNFIDKESQDTFYFHRRKVIKTRAPQRCELLLIRKDKTSFWAQLECTGIFDETEEVTQINANLVDITDRKQLELESAEQARDLQEINTAMAMQNEAIVVVNQAISGFVKAMTIEETCTILTRTLIEELKIPRIIVGLKKADDTFEIVNAEGFPRAISRQETLNCLFCERAIPLVLKTGRRVMKEDFAGDGSACAGLLEDCSFWPIKGKKGVLGILIMDNPDTEKADTLSMFLNQAGAFLETAILYQDMARKNEEILVANQKLKELDVQKSEFLNIVTHDLRTPLTSIRSYADLLLMYKDEPLEVREEFLTIISQESVRLGNLINDFLDLSRIESGTMKYNIKPCDFKELITHTLAVFQGETDRKKIDLTSAFEPDLPEIMADGDRFGQVLVNLLSNAVKFTPEGGAISIAARSTADHEVEMSVTDTGYGLAPENHQKIFEKFGQVEDRGDGKVKGGTGLGLAITKEIVKKHGGSIRVESELGKGARFVVTLPAKNNG